MNAELQHPHTRQALYRRDRRSVRLAREFTREALTDWQVGPRADDVLLCVSELTTNALLHGVPPGRGFRLRLALHPDGVLRTEVHDSGPGELRFGDVSPESEHGRGLLLVTLLADKWGTGEREPGKVVWCEFAVRGARVALSSFVTPCPRDCTMTATGPEQVAFMENAGLPLSSTSHKTFTEVEPTRRLAYTTLADFIPGVEPYEFLTEVELRPAVDGGTHVTMTADTMHDEEWTGRLAAGRTNEMDNLAKVVAS